MGGYFGKAFGLASRLRQQFYDHAVLDRLVAVSILPFILLILIIIYPIALATQGRPFLYASERMRSEKSSFRLYKIRTMRPSDRGPIAVLGGDQTNRITRLGHILRSSRIDELPQIFNVLKGDMRFIGPRPPLRQHVAEYPDHFAQVLKSKPGITGLATVLVYRRESRILRKCTTPLQTEQTYRTHCLPLKMRLDAIYARHRSLALDAFIVFRTVQCLFRALRPNLSPSGTEQRNYRLESSGRTHIEDAA
ncbi:MAG: sugar transferase [Boseongicola sp.]|nr:sugar transferase [Boseongicola sp.]